MHRRAATSWSGPAHADFPFVDLATGERWTLRINDGRIPWWIFDASAPRAGHARARLSGAGALLRPPRDATIGEVIACRGPLYERLIGPLLLAALNTEPPEGSAALAARGACARRWRGRAAPAAR